MFGQPSADGVLNSELVPGVASTDNAVDQGPYACAVARERLAPLGAPVGATAAESHETVAAAAINVKQSDRVVIRVDILTPP